MTAILFTRKSSNVKTGPIPVSTTDRKSCPSDCPFKGNGCYADGGPLGYLWTAMSEAGPNAEFKNGRATMNTTDWEGLCQSVASLPEGQLWRHNQAGDLPKDDKGNVDAAMVEALVAANAGRKGFTYTHHNVAQNAHNRAIVEAANADGFTVNVSANSLAHADALADAVKAPVVVVLPASVEGKADIATPKGRKVVVCPATYRDDVSCATCGLCAVANRKVVVGFPAHGASKRKADAIAAA